MAEPHTISPVKVHTVAGGMRSGRAPSAELDAAGRIYLVWNDCRFRRNCRQNDIVMTTSGDGTAWSPVTRIPIDGKKSTVEHFIPAIAVDGTTSGSHARLAVAYHSYPAFRCTVATCRLYVGILTSSDGGATWVGRVQLAGPMSLDGLANTNRGRMVGDYISASFAGGLPHPVFAAATSPDGPTFHEAIVCVTAL